LRSFDPESPDGAEVPDPYGGGDDGFEHVLDLCERACRGLLEYVRARL
jgi:protein-tyrosine phosphatase